MFCKIALKAVLWSDKVIAMCPKEDIRYCKLISGVMKTKNEGGCNKRTKKYKELTANHSKRMGLHNFAMCLMYVFSIKYLKPYWFF